MGDNFDFDDIPNEQDNSYLVDLIDEKSAPSFSNSWRSDIEDPMSNQDSIGDTFSTTGIDGFKGNKKYKKKSDNSIGDEYFQFTANSNNPSDVSYINDKQFSSNGELYSVKCNNCGTVFSTSTKSKHSNCILCGSKNLDRVSVDLTNYYILPFKVSKKQVLKEYKKRVLNPLIPLKFKKKNLKDSIRCIYIPTYLIDFNVNGKIGFFSAFSYGADKSSMSDRHYLVYSTNFDFENVCLNRYSKMYEYYFNSCCNYDYSKIFSYDFDLQDIGDSVIIDGDLSQEETLNRLDTRVEQYIKDIVKSTIRYESTKFDRHKLNTKYLAAKNLLVPVYFLNIKYGDNNYMFLMNGQNGIVRSEFPISKFAIVVVSLLTFAFVFLIGFLICYFI